MEPTTAVDNITGWAAYGPLTRGIVVASWVGLLVVVGLFVWSGVLARADEAAAAKTTPPVVINANIELHNHFHLGDRVGENDPLPTGWERRLDLQGRVTVETSSKEEMDFGKVEMKTVGLVSPEGKITALFRFINILEGGSWDVDRWSVLRDAGGQEVPLAARFKAGQFGDRLVFADDVICVGLSSRQRVSDPEHLETLSYNRALTLARAVVKADVLHHPQTLYTLHLGGARATRVLGSPSEPGQRSAVVIGVQRADKDALLVRDIADVVTRAELSTTNLMDFTGADEAHKRLHLAAPHAFQDPVASKPATAPKPRVIGE